MTMTLMVGLWVILSGCSETSTEPLEPGRVEAGQGHLNHGRVEFFEAHPALAHGAGVLEREVPFKQVGFHFRTTRDERMRYRVRTTDGRWSAWEPLPITWREGELRVGRILLEAEAVALELDGASGVLAGKIEFYEEVVARADVLTRELPFAAPEVAPEGMARQEIAPRSLVIPRAEWGSRDPSKVCGSPHDPYRMAIHHTYLPAGDGSDPAATVRSIQAYHIDSNGWCDIGYHFVVSQSGNVYQGRSDEERLGAHTGGQNTGNIGICFIGDFTSQTPGAAQVDAAVGIVRWVGETYGIAFDRGSIKGHGEWPGQSTACPGQNLLAEIDTIIERAAGGEPPAAPDPVRLEVKYVGLDDFYGQGSSATLGDALVGDRFQVEMLVSNETGEVIRDVYLGYLIEEPYLLARDYTVYSDYPALDRQTWQVNDASEAEDNPAPDSLGAEGRLNLFAFSPGETKRVLVEMEAAEYSYGRVDHPDVRAWLSAASRDGGAALYGPQERWDAEPVVNLFGVVVRDFDQMDVLEEDRWTFDDRSDEANFEGWTALGDVSEVRLNTEDGLLTAKVDGVDGGLQSPPWTRVDADTYDELVLRVRSHDGPHVKEVYWRRAGEDFAEERVVRFEAEGDGELETLVVPVGLHSQWTGRVEGLRVDLVDRAPGEVERGWYGLDEVFFQARGAGSTTNDGEAVAAAPVDLLDVDDGGDGGGSDVGVGGGGSGGGAGAGGEGAGGTSGDVQVKRGCSAVGGRSGPGGVGFWLVVAMVFAWNRRRDVD